MSLPFVYRVYGSGCGLRYTVHGTSLSVGARVVHLFLTIAEVARGHSYGAICVVGGLNSFTCAHVI